MPDSYPPQPRLFRSSNEKEPEFQMFVFLEGNPDGEVRDFTRGYPHYKWLLDDAIELFSGSIAGCPPHYLGEISAQKISYNNRGEMITEDIAEKLISDAIEESDEVKDFFNKKGRNNNGTECFHPDSLQPKSNI